MTTGEDLKFSRRGEGADVSKVVTNLIFFISLTKLIFRALTEHYKDPILPQISSRQSKFSKHRPKIPFWELYG